MSEHFKEAKGYDLYANAAELFREVGLETVVQTYVGNQSWGTPQQLLEKLEERRRLLGGFEMLVIPRYGGMDGDSAEASLRLFAKDVLPEVQSW